MAAAHSMDVRARVSQVADAGIPSRMLAERSHVSLAWVDALKQRSRGTRPVAPTSPQTAFSGRVLASQGSIARAGAEPPLHAAAAITPRPGTGRRTR